MAKRMTDIERMTVEAFLAWDDGTETRYELVNGQLVAMAPAKVAHARITMNVGFEIERMVEGRPPCRALEGPGVVIDEATGSLYVPDVAMTCEPVDASDRTIKEPRLVVEVLSPSTTHYDQTHKVPDYAALASVIEIWLVSSEARTVQVWRREAEGWKSDLPYVGAQTFPSPALGGEVALDRLYRLTGL